MCSVAANHRSSLSLLLLLLFVQLLLDDAHHLIVIRAAVCAVYDVLWDPVALVQLRVHGDQDGEVLSRRHVYPVVRIGGDNGWHAGGYLDAGSGDVGQ